MGNDGGSIPKRRELVKEAAKNPNLTDLKEKQKEHLAHRWSQCPISHKALTKPIVADFSGNLYNKDAVLQFLLPDDSSPLDKVEARKFVQGRINSLRDIVEVHFEAERDEVTKFEKWLCPVTAKELGVNIKAVFLVPCGHSFAKEAIEVMKDVTACPTCGSQFEARDVVPILPSTESDKAAVVERMEILKALGLTHSLKKAPGSKKRKAERISKPEITVSEDKVANGVTHDHLQRTTTPQIAPSTSNSFSGIRNAATASLTAKVLEEEEAKKRRRLDNENLRSLYTPKGSTKVRDGDFMTRGFSIPANAKSS